MKQKPKMKYSKFFALTATFVIFGLSALIPYEGFYTEDGNWISVKTILGGLGLVTTWLLYFKYRDRIDEE